RVNSEYLLAIMGESGTGKSTVSHILGARDRACEGSVCFAKMALHKLDEDAAADFRGRELGFVWQFHYLLPEFTAQENVAMPLFMKSAPQKQSLEKAMQWLREVG